MGDKPSAIITKPPKIEEESTTALYNEAKNEEELTRVLKENNLKPIFVDNKINVSSHHFYPKKNRSLKV